MHVAARIRNTPTGHEVVVSSLRAERPFPVPAKANGRGSSANGGEMLCLAVATCYCNDLFREAAKRGIEVDSVEVDVTADFPAEGAAARTLGYSVRVRGDAPEAQLRELALATDRVAEIQNTLRGGIAVTLDDVAVLPGF